MDGSAPGAACISPADLQRDVMALARLVTEDQVRYTSFVVLDAVVEAITGVRRDGGSSDVPGHDALRTSISQALAVIEDERRRRAAAAYWAWGPDRWRKLDARRRQAAVELGLRGGADTMRKIRHDGSRREEELAGILTDALLTLATTPGSRSEPGDQVPPVATGDERRKRGIVIAVALATLALLAVVVATVLLRGSAATPERVLGRQMSADASAERGASSHPPATLPSDACKYKIGAAEGPLVAQDLALLDPLVAAAVGHAVCGRGPVTSLATILYQELGTDAAPSGAVVASAPSRAVVLTQAQWGTYHQIGGLTAEQSVQLAGAPVRREHRHGGSAVVLDGGGLMLGRTPDDPHFWMHPASLARWLEEGGPSGLGLPMSNPMGRDGMIVQDFEYGFLQLRGDAGIAAFLVHDRAAALPTADLRGRVLRQADRTAWFVDHDLVRHWIADGPTWECLRGTEIQIGGDVAGFAIATLPLGGHAVCP